MTDQNPIDQPSNNLAVPVSEYDHRQGDLSAPIVLVEYGDYECPDCLNAYPRVRALRDQLQDRLCFIFRHFPVSSVHPHASVAAQAAEAAAYQNKFWEMHELLFRHQAELGEIDLTHLALRLGLELYKFASDMERPAALRKIRDDYAGGERSGVHGTPTFFLNGTRYEADLNADAISAAVRV